MFFNPLLVGFLVIAANPNSPRVPRILPGRCILPTEPGELQSWKGRHWAVFENGSKFEILNSEFHAIENRSDDPEQPECWDIRGDYKGGVVFFFDGIHSKKPRQSVNDLHRDLNSDLVQQLHKDLGTWHGVLFQVSYIPRTSGQPSDVELQIGHTKETIGQVWPWCGMTTRWAGDIDGDGELDLFVEYQDDKGGSEYILYLSSKAKPGHLLGEAAKYYITGD